MQIQKYEVNTLSAPSTSTPFVTKATVNNVGNINKPISGTSTLAQGLSTVLGKGMTGANTSLPVAIKSSVSVTSISGKSPIIFSTMKTAAQVPVQLTTHAKTQQITLAALNQLTSGKIAGSQIIGTAGKTVQIISQAKQGQPLKKSIQIGKTVANTAAASIPQITSNKLSNISISGTSGTQTSAATQYALVRAQVPGTGGAPPQTVTFIRAIAPTSGSAAGSSVTVTPNQMTVLLNSQQGQTQGQKVLNSATSVTQVRPNTPVGHLSPSKIVSIQLPQKVVKTTGTIVGTKLSITTQSTTLSPMATLVSGAGVRFNSCQNANSSLVSQFPTVKSSNAALLANIAAVKGIIVTTKAMPVSSTAAISSFASTETSSVSTSNSNPHTTISSTSADQQQVTSTTHADLKPDESENGCVSLKESSSDEAGPLLVSNANKRVEETQSKSKTEEESTTTEVEPMQVDAIKKEEKEIAIEPGIKSLTSANLDVKIGKDSVASIHSLIPENGIKHEASESLAATTLAQLASLAGQQTKQISTLSNDISNNPLSTLAALASSSPIVPTVNATDSNGKTDLKPEILLSENAKKVTIFSKVFVY